MANIDFIDAEIKFLSENRDFLQKEKPERVWQKMSMDLPNMKSAAKLFILWAFYSNNSIYYIRPEGAQWYSFFCSKVSFTNAFYIGSSENSDYADSGIKSFIEKSLIYDKDLINQMLKKDMFVCLKRIRL